MNILIVSYDYRPRLGGVATCSYQLAKALNQIEGINIHLLTGKTEGDLLFDQAQDFKVTRAELPKSAFKAIIPIYKEIKRITRSSKIDLIINMLWMPSGISSLLFSIFNSTPYYIFAHGVEVLESKSTLKKRIRGYLSPLKNLAYKKATKVFCVSHFTAQLINKICHVKKEKIQVVYNGVDSNYFVKKQKNTTLSKQYNLKDEVIFTTITRLDDYKGVDNAIKAFSKLREEYPNFKYLVGGIGQEEHRLKSLIKDHNLDNHIIMCGKIPEDDIVDFYNLSDVFILLSRNNYQAPNVEGFGLVFLEAAACGVPSLAGKSGGISDAVLHEETGLLVDPENIQEIASSLRKFITNTNYTKKLSEGAYIHSKENMSWDQMAKRVIKGIESCAE